jgi:hypothetical protein
LAMVLAPLEAGPPNDLAVQLRATGPRIPNSTIHRGPALRPARGARLSERPQLQPIVRQLLR